MSKTWTLFLTLAAVLLAAPTAHAGQFVYGSGDDIRVVDDDGSDDRVLVPLSAVPGAISLYSPWVAPNGTTVLFQARTPHPGMSGLYCGFNCVGIYALQDGAVFRISGGTTDCAGDQCFGLNLDPRLGPDGALYHQLLYGEYDGDFTPSTLTNEFVTPPGGEETELPDGECGNTDDSPEPNPVVPGEYAISNYCVGGDGYTLMIQDVAGNSEKRFFDDYAFTNIVYRGDGQMLASVEDGADAGLWTYPRSGGTPHQALPLTYTDEQSAYDTHLTFVGQSRLGFVWNDAIRTVAADCAGCALGSAATVIQSTDVDGLAWTAQAVPGITSDPGTGPGSGPGSGPGTGPGTTPAATLAAITSRPKLAKALRKGIKVPFTATAPGELRLTATIAGKLAKKLKLAKTARKPVVVAKGAATLAAAGQGTAKLKFTAAARKRLKKARKVALALGGTFAGTALPASKLTLKK